MLPRFHVLALTILCLSLLPITAIIPNTAQARSARPYLQSDPCGLAALPGAVDGGELPNAVKRSAFAEVATTNRVYGEYDFRLNTANTAYGTILPALPRSIAGIESEWTQYSSESGRTISNPNLNGTCDYGIMQVNSSSTALFTRQPLLLSDTRGNIAAGTTILAEKWNSGAAPSGTLPVVNDGDPERLLNWYYALSSYNGGPQGAAGWANNPNCGEQLSCAGG